MLMKFWEDHILPKIIILKGRRVGWRVQSLKYFEVSEKTLEIFNFDLILTFRKTCHNTEFLSPVLSRIMKEP